MICTMDRLRIQVLRDAGHTLAQVADLVGVSTRSVQRVAQVSCQGALKTGQWGALQNRPL